MRKNRVDINCKICNKVVAKKPSTIRVNNFCSRLCKDKWQSERMMGKNNPVYVERPILVCTECGDEFQRDSVTKIDINHNYFCDRICEGKWNSKNKVGYKAPCWKGGLNKCIDCETILGDRKASRCRSCHAKYVVKLQKEKPINKINRAIRSSKKYAKWRNMIYEKHDYTCVCCNKRGDKVDVHHTEPFFEYLSENNIIKVSEAYKHEYLWREEMGVVLCRNCHREFHYKYGIKNFTKNDLKEFTGVEI